MIILLLLLYATLLLDDTDYLLEPRQLTFSTGNQIICINIELLDDLIVELEEMFTVMLSTMDNRITFAFDTAIITIADNDDGEHKYNVLFH